MNATIAPNLTPSDRCDRCGAQSYVKSSLAGGGSLLFCAHHSRAHLDKLRDLPDVQIIDETYRLTGEDPLERPAELGADEVR